MIRLKIIKDGKYKKGEVIYVSPNEAHGLIDSGYAVISKDITSRDMKAK